MEKQPLISVIVPVYNVEEYLPRCLDSIINQTYTNLEILLIDDGATDNSGKICDEYAQKDNRIRVFHKPNGGVSSARNMGLDNSTGEYVGFIDSDDYVELEYFEVLLGVAKEHNADIARCCEFEESHTDESKVDIYLSKEYNFLQKHTTEKLGNVVAGALYKIEIVQPLRFTSGLYVGEDSYFNAQAVKRSILSVATSKKMYHYITRVGSATHCSFNKKLYTEIDSWVKICELDYGNKKTKQSCYAALAIRCRAMIERYYFNDNFKKNYYKQTLRLYRKYYRYWNKYSSTTFKAKVISFLFYIFPSIIVRLKKNRGI